MINNNVGLLKKVWLLTCVLFVFLALVEYALLLYTKNMRGVKKRLFKSGILGKEIDKNY